jgi:hypothetical protein
MKLKPLALSALLAMSLAGQALAGDEGIVFSQASEDGSYCHIKYMAFTENSLKSGDLEFDEGNIVDKYGPCGFDPKSPEEVRKQVSLMSRGINGDGSNDSSGSSD